MPADPTQRFSSRVDDYVRYRPSYPPELIPLLERECQLTPASVIADVGSGTGLLAELFLRIGCEVFCIEPNVDMRVAGERILSSYPRAHSVNGRAEDTTLAASSVDIVTAGQAFHWFNPLAARNEFVRILRPPGWVVLVWNERLVSGDPFLVGYEALLQRYAPDYAQVDHRRIDAVAIDDFFGHGNWTTREFPNAQEFDVEGVRGRLHSSSYTPQPGSAAYEPMMRELETLFSESQRNGKIQFAYRTIVYFGTLSIADRIEGSCGGLD